MLTAEQIAARTGKLTASRIACLMRGDKAAIMRLYREMVGNEPAEDLSGIWPVQLGACTEKLNLDWFEAKHGVLTRRGEVVRHPSLPWAAATLDAWSPSLACPVETKHVGGREPLDTIIERYQPQCQWQMEVTRASRCALSIIQGADEPIREFINVAPDYIAEMVRRGAQFMECIAQRTPPVVLDPAPAPVDATRDHDMAGNNAWANYAAVWLEHEGHVTVAKEAEKLLKTAVPADARTCFGHGVRITRDRAGRLSLRKLEV